MTNLNQVYTKPTILEAFETARVEIKNFFWIMPLDCFLGQSETEWHGSQTLEHLAKGIESVANALALPKEFIRRRWGVPEKASGSFEDIRMLYSQALANGAQSPETFRPSTATDSMDVAAYKHSLLEQWQSANEKLFRSMDSWADGELDQYALMHPVLGKLTVREILLCMLCHNQEHLDKENRAEI